MVFKYALFSESIVSKFYFELASISKNRSSNFRDFTVYQSLFWRKKCATILFMQFIDTILTPEDKVVKPLTVTYTHHAVYFQDKMEFSWDPMDLDEIRKVKASSHIFIMCWQHLCEYNMWSVSDQDNEIVNCVVWNKQWVNPWVRIPLTLCILMESSWVKVQYFQNHELLRFKSINS